MIASETQEDIEEFSIGVTKRILLTALKIGIPIYDLEKNEIWSPN
jgi:hypothetical protein